MLFVPNYLFPPKNRKPISLERRRRLVFSYAPDWIITVGLVIALYFVDRIHGNWREFSLTDTSIQHTFATRERVPVWALALIVISPLAFYALIGLGIMRSFWDFHAAFLGNVLSVGLTTVITTIIKVMVGRPRPDLIDRCQPSSGAVNAIPFGLATSAICTTTDFGRIQEGFRSFPSGHASTAWSGLGFFGLYLAGKLHLFDQRGHTVKAWIAVIPFFGAALIAISRVMDYRHHATDIIAGSLLGMIIAHFSYRLYYPSLTDPLAHRPYSPRIAESDIESDMAANGTNQGIDTSEDDHLYNNDREGPEGSVRRPGGNGQDATSALKMHISPTSYNNLEAGRYH